MKDIAIVCDVLKDAFEKLKKELSHNHMDYIFLEQHLHDTPDKMRKKLQETIDGIDPKYDRIILGYGQCSNGVVGLRSKNQEIIVPKVDDCISLFLGSREEYLKEFQKDPATYYLCKGWIEYGADPYRGYLVNTGQEDKIPASWIRNRERYGKRKIDKETAKFLTAQMMRNYKRVLLINNHDLEEIHRKYARDMADFLSSIIGRNIELAEVQGSSKLLKELFGKKWKKDHFVVKGKGQKIGQQDFM